MGHGFPIGRELAADLSTTNGLLHTPDAPLRILHKIVFPNADNSPALLAQLTIYELVAGFVCVEFPFPEGAVGFRHGAMLRTKVPEASVNKHRNLFSMKNKIRFSKDPLFPPPTSNPISPQYLRKNEFRFSVAGAPNSRHYVRTFLLRKDVSQDVVEGVS